MDEEQTARLRRVVGRLARRLNTAAAGENLTPTQSSVLALVCILGPLPLAELTRVEGLNPTMTSRVVRSMVEAGLIHRVPGHRDQRTATVEATPAGHAAHDRIRAHRNALVAEGLAGLSADDEARLCAALPALEALTDHVATPA